MVLPEGWTATGYEYDNTQLFRHTDGREQKGNPGKPEGIIAIANAIPDMGALTSLNMSKNRIKGAEAGKALGDALAGNTLLKELDLSGEEHYPNMDIGFVRVFTPGLSDNRAMSSLNLAKNCLCGVDEDGDGTYDASGNMYMLSCSGDSPTQAIITHSRYYRACQCHPRHEGVDEPACRGERHP
jgi:hypothetical protein